MSARRLDLRGEVCPFTFVRTRLFLEDQPLGTAVVVVVDHEPASRSVPRALREWGQHVGEVVTIEGGWEIHAEKRVE